MEKLRQIDPQHKITRNSAKELINSLTKARMDNGDECRLYTLYDDYGEEIGRVGSRWSGSRCTTAIILNTCCGELGHIVDTWSLSYDAEMGNMNTILQELSPWLIKCGFVFPKPKPMTMNNWKLVMDWNGISVKQELL